jgi:hypothetical protein
MAMAKICPIILAGCFASPPATIFFDPDCKEEGCAWWDEDEERCAVLQIVWVLDRLTDRLDLNLREQLGNQKEKPHGKKSTGN